jgi:DNA-binding transcriptional LysR family regulator
MGLNFWFKPEVCIVRGATKMNLNQMKMFVTVVEHKGFSSAGRHLNLSPTAISKQIKSLEDILGLQLIVRTSTKFEITDVGDLFYDNCKRILKDVDSLEDVVQSYQNEPSGKLLVFSTSAFAEIYLVPHIKEFLTHYPKITLTLDVGDRFADIRKEGIDLAFGITEHWDQELIQKKLITTGFGFYASPSYLKQHGEPQTRGDLLDHFFICHSGLPNPNLVYFRNGDTLEVRASVMTNDNAAYLSFAKDGLGVLVTLDVAAKALVCAGLLKKILEKEELPFANYNVYFSPTQHLKPASRAFLDFVMSKIKAL